MVNDYIKIDVNLQQTISSDQAWYYHIIPKSSTDGLIELFIDEEYPNGQTLCDELEVLFGQKVKLFKTKSPIIKKSLGKYYRRAVNKNGYKATLINTHQSKDFLYQLISEAQSINSSDIHIEPYKERSRIRLRIDGKLIERYVIKKQDYPALINKIKIKANLDIAEKRLPQDGRIFFDTDNTSFDIRVSVLPTLYGEKIVLRLLSKDTTTVEISELGFNKKQMNDYLEGIRKTNGIVLISGPTGSGKTTTLYATLKILNKEDRNILTIEDPIEYTLEGINQVQLKEAIGLTFASALRTFLRQDPDIIMLGEIRDVGTAQMAIRAALTGHLVLSTIHTNSAWGTISRLIDMGVPSFLVANTINLTVSQRLVRLLCPDCKLENKITSGVLPRNYIPPHKIHTHFVANGCEECFFTGYKGRKAVYEVISVDSELGEYIKKNDFDVCSLLRQKKISPMSDQAFTLFSNGDTSGEEVYPILLNSVV